MGHYLLDKQYVPVVHLNRKYGKKAEPEQIDILDASSPVWETKTFSGKGALFIQTYYVFC